MNKREEEYALKNNKGILYEKAPMSLDEISISFMNGFNALIDSQEHGSENRAMLGYIKHRMNISGIIIPAQFLSEHVFPLTKDDLLILCGQLQLHSVTHNYNNHKRQLFKDAAEKLRMYLYANYKLSENDLKEFKTKRNPQPPVEKVENVAKP